MSDNKQLIRKENGGGYRNIYPYSFTETVKDKKTGKSLEEILVGTNFLYLPYRDSKAATRLQVDERYRRKGLWVQYITDLGSLVVEYYNNEDISNNKWVDDRYWVPYNSAQFNPGTIGLDAISQEAKDYLLTNSPVNTEDITRDSQSRLQLADRRYNPETPNGKGYKILRPNILNGVNTLAQSMITEANTIYEIRYDYDLLGQEITIPEGCTLKFNGGSFKNGILNSTYFQLNMWAFANITINGFFEFNTPINVPNYNAKEFIETILKGKPIESTNPTVFIFGESKPYIWEGVLNFNKKNITLTGGGTIEGTIHLGITAELYNELKYGQDWSIGHFNFIITNLRFSKYSVIGTNTDGEAINLYIENASVSEDKNIAISLINVNHVKISKCFFDNVPFPVVYKPNEVYVNQNVRRLNIVDCDFERCNIAVYATSILNSPIEYGDLLFSHNNIFPVNYGLYLECIDGFKCHNNIFSLSTNKGMNIFADKCGQIMITDNSFYGEFNKCAVLLQSPTKAIINNNSFSSQSTKGESYPTDKDSIAALIIRRNETVSVCMSLNIVGNQFSNVNKRLMIFISGYFRGLSILGNSMDTDNYDSMKKYLYSIPNYPLSTQYIPFLDTYESPYKGVCELQDIFPVKRPVKGKELLDLRLQVLKDYLLLNPYSDRNEDINNKIYSFNELKVRVKFIEKYKPIFTFFYWGVGKDATVTFYFNSIRYQISVLSTDSINEVYMKIISVLSADWGESYNFRNIGNVLWIVGKTIDAPCYSPFILEGNSEVDTSLSCVYQNLGYRIALKDEFNNNFITGDNYETWAYSGIDMDDNGKKLIIDNKSLTLITYRKEGALAKLFTRTIPTPTYSYRNMFIFNDTYFGFFIGSTLSNRELISEIISFAYPDIYRAEGDYIVFTKDVEQEYSQITDGLAWYCTYNEHVVDYNILTDTGLIYYPSKKVFNNQGSSAARPKVTDIGFQFYDSTLNKPICWNGEYWLEEDKVLAGTSRIGAFTQRPTIEDNFIRKGFAYFCTDRQTIEGASNGIMIYHKGNNVWVDALGRVIS